MSNQVCWSIRSPEPPVAPLARCGDLLLLPAAAGLHALSLVDGAARWHFPLDAGARLSGVAVAGRRYFVAAHSADPTGTQGALVALDPTGQARWRWEPGLRQVSAPAVLGERVYVTALGSAGAALVSLALAEGGERGRVPLPGTPSRAALLLVGDVALIPCAGPYLLAVDVAAGAVRWRFDLPDDAWLDQTPCVAGETVLAVSSVGALLALQLTDGALLWRRAVGPVGKPLSAPAAEGERVYVGARDGVHALRLGDGAPVWPFPTERRVAAAPLLAGDTLYVAGHDHCLYALEAATGAERWRHTAERRLEVPPLLAECAGQPCVIVADQGGTVTALPLAAEPPPGQIVHNYYGPVVTVQNGAVALGPGSTALGASAVQVGDVGGDVVTGNKSETGGEARPPGGSIAALRARLGRLDDVDLDALCLDHFPAVYDKFGRGLRRDEKVNLLLDYCRRNPEEAARLAQLLP